MNKVTNSKKESSYGLVMLVVIIVMALAMFLMSMSGCAYQNTDGISRKLLPVEFGVYAKAAVASGETEQRVGLSKNAITEVMQADNGFNEARAKIGVAEAKNKMNSVSYSGPQQSDAALHLTTSQRVQNALDMRK